VPNCKDIKIKNDRPGPGHYSNVFPDKTGGDLSRIGSSTQDS